MSFYYNNKTEATYYWKRFDGEIVSKNNALMITKAQHRSDAGIYTCWAINKHGNTSYEVQLTVTCKFLCKAYKY